jgi:hypothetical protein
MPRIRTIKPETPQSESMGRISREARLCFILLWTQADDAGRLRGNSRMLASLLYPYDDDAPALIEDWLEELEGEDCIIRYEAGGATYMQIVKWLEHQKIDKPSRSKMPGPDEGSRIFARPREVSCLDQGPRTKDQGEDQEARGAENGTLPLLSNADVEKAVERWNEVLAPRGLPAVKKLTDVRRRKLAARLRSDGGLPNWEAALWKVAENPFLLGQNERGWRADFDFLLQEKSFTKLMEGGYDRRPGVNGRAGFAGVATDDQLQRMKAQTEERNAKLLEGMEP